MQTAEVYALANPAIGIWTYSSAIFNFVPEYAQRFFAAIHSGDTAFTSEAARSFFIPYLALRNQRRGYAVSLADLEGDGASGAPAMRAEEEAQNNN